MTSFDPAVFARAAAYEAALPEGLDSHPQCEVRTLVVKPVVERYPDLLDHRGIDAAVSRKIRHVLEEAEWMQESLGTVTRILARDLVLTSDAEYMQWSFEASSHIFRQRVYRALMYVVSPTLVMLGAQKRWNAFRRGSTLSAQVVHKEGQIRLDFPEHLYTELVLLGFGEAFHASLVAARARNPEVTLVESAPTCARWTIRWQ